MGYTTIIKNVEISVAIIDCYRITKGGKRILTRDPAYSLHLKLEVLPISQLRNGDVVIVSKRVFMYSINDNKATLINGKHINTDSLQFNTNQPIDLTPIGRQFTGE